MKWQEFYFKWLENIGYFQWWNATLVGHKTTEPVGGRNNTGTVCFGGEGGIEGFPSRPIASHPAQPLIDAALEDTGRLDPSPIRRMRMARGGTGMSVNLMAYLGGDTFGESQKNTLRYWGVQPEGSTFLPDSNFYRGYEYYINAMKQKYELRGPRGGRLLTEKDWLTDKQNRTYPTTRRATSGHMIAAKHPDYQDYADIGNIMQVEWGVFNGYSNIVYSPAWSQETWDEGQPESQSDATTWIDERTSSGKDVIMRNKLFDEKNYITDKLKHELLQEITQILLREAPQISMITAETILQYLSLNFIGLNMEGHPTLPEGYTETLEALPISSDTISELKRLLYLWPLLQEDPPVSFYLNFPCSSLFLVPAEPRTTAGISGYRAVTVFGNQCKSLDDSYEIAGGYNTLAQNQGTDVGLITNLLEWWQTFMIVDESLQPFITSFRNMFNIMIDRNTAEGDPESTQITLSPTNDAALSQSMTYWLFTIPPWVNIDYAMAIATYFGESGEGWTGRPTQPGGLGIVPKEILFELEGSPQQYTYEIALSEWWPLYQSPAPSISELRYWNIYTAFIHPSTKKTRGMEAPELMEIHAINLYPSSNHGPIRFNNIGVSSVENAESLRNGVITSGEEIPQITYKFWNEGQYWPIMPPKAPDNSPQQQGYGRRGGGQGKVGDLRSFLTPMTTIHNDWWNEFLGENGILSMETEPDPNNAQSPIKMGLGWEIAWSWSHMENVIWTNRLNEIEWANNLTLEDFTGRVYPTLPMNLSFEPKLPPNTNVIQRNYVAAQAGFRDYKVGATKQEDELFRTNRRNLKITQEDGGEELIAVEDVRPFSMMALNPSIGTRGYENSSNYVITAPNRNVTTIFEENANTVRGGSEWVWKRLQVSAVGDVHAFHIFNNSITLEDDNGNIALIPNNTPYARSFNDEKWAEIRAATGYMNEGLHWVGGHERMLNRALGYDEDENEMVYSDMPKINIDGVPDDIFEMEELTDLRNKTIDYTAPTSSPWRRGKIPLINWAAILSNKIISMIMPQEED